MKTSENTHYEVREEISTRARSGYDQIWRFPDEESHLYPGLCLHDGRQSGSITVSCSRLPLWAFAGWMHKTGWEEVVTGWDYIETEYGWDADKMGEFIYCLMEQRGEFGRLLLVLADAERCEQNRRGVAGKPWWRTKKHNKRVADQLRRCLEALEGIEL